jgi:hypothetical protein
MNGRRHIVLVTPLVRTYWLDPDKPVPTPSELLAMTPADGPYERTDEARIETGVAHG